MSQAHNPNERHPDGLSNLRRMAYFAAVVETGSFTAAAERLGITKSVVSQQVARLEKTFQTTLLARTTRKVQPTEAGLAFYQRCALILQEADSAFDELGETAASPSGTLRLTAPFDYGVSVVTPAIAAFTQTYPACNVEAVMSDQMLDLISNNVELAIRVGWLTETSQQARKIGTFKQLLVASPAFKSRLARIAQPALIASLPFIANTALRAPLSWDFSHSTSANEVVKPQASIFLDTTLAVREAVRAGAGLSVLPDYVVEDDLKQGRLVHVLPDWLLPSGGIHAVFPAARFRSPKVRAFVELLAEREQQRQANSRMSPA